MQLSKAGLDLIKRSEGFRGRVYRDVAEILTIGYGHKLLRNESFPDGINEARAAGLLEADVQFAERVVERLVKVPLTQGQFDALVDFCFNMGAGRLAESSLLRDLNSGRYEAAGDQLLLWDHAGAEINEGLKTRREAEHSLWHEGSGAQQAA